MLPPGAKVDTALCPGSAQLAAALTCVFSYRRAHLALTCRAASQAVLAEPLEAEVSIAPKGVTSFNACLAKRVAAGAAPVRAVSSRGCSSAASQLEHEISAACHLSLCSTQRLELFEPCSYLLEAARGIRSLTRLFFTAFVPWCSLAPLDGMPQLRDLEAVLGIDGIQIEWSPRMPGLTALSLRNMGRITLCLDGLAALEQLVLYCDLHGDSDVAVETSRAVPQLKHLDVRCMRELALPWQRLVGLQELVLRGEPGGSIPCHSGCTHLRGLRSLRVDLKEVQLPPGPWLASVTRLMVLGAHKQVRLCWLMGNVMQVQHPAAVLTPALTLFCMFLQLAPCPNLH